MITFSFENGAVITLRTSGTEPKIKYYAEMCANPSEKYGSITIFIDCIFHKLTPAKFQNDSDLFLFVFFFLVQKLGGFTNNT